MYKTLIFVLLILLVKLLIGSCNNIEGDIKFTNQTGYSKKIALLSKDGLWTYQEKWDDVKPVIQINNQDHKCNVNRNDTSITETYHTPNNNNNNLNVYIPKNKVDEQTYRNRRHNTIDKTFEQDQTDHITENNILYPSRDSIINVANKNQIYFKEPMPNVKDDAKFKWYYRYQENRPENSRIPYK